MNVNPFCTTLVKQARNPALILLPYQSLQRQNKLTRLRSNSLIVLQGFNSLSA
jgi:hypothetical protein